MILPSVSETLAPVTHHPALESAIAALRHRITRERLAGLTETAKTLVAASVAAELRRPVVVLVETSARAESFAASLEFFFSALAGQEATSVVILPSVDVLPWQDAAPHAEILETRAVTLWRYATGQARVVVAPVAAARMRLADAAHYAGQARTLARDEDVSLDDLVSHLRRVGYESHDTVEMPGQFAVRGGIGDIFPAGAERPVRLELFGDSVESLREFDPNTQRSVRPIERVTLPPLVEQASNGFGPGSGATTGVERVSHAHSLFELREDTVVLLDESAALEETSRAFLENAMESLESGGRDSMELLSSYFFAADWESHLAAHATLELEHLAITREDSETRSIATQPTPRFHGNVSAFMAEARSRIAAGERVLMATGNLGELERYVDLCHEYEVPYRLGEIEESATSARLAEDSSAGSVPAVVLCRAPFTDGVVFVEAGVAIYGTGDLFETMPPAP